jgi:uncharacterized tellurite resistance protein B-like protein
VHCIAGLVWLDRNAESSGIVSRCGLEVDSHLVGHRRTGGTAIRAAPARRSTRWSISEPHRARFLAAFAYLLGRVARADLQVSTEETRTMEALVREQGQLSQDQAMVVVQLAKTSNLLFGGTANFLVAREFASWRPTDQKLALMRCLFALAAIDESISTAEEGEIHRIATELRIDQPDLVRSECPTSGTCRACPAR